jgi:O-antigen/teichoic acid export membrane protein
VIGAATLQPLITAWLGPGKDLAALLGAFLVLGSACGLMTGTGVAYLRAIGRPGLEARYGLVVVALNISLTVPLAFAFGAVGVVAGTLAAYLTGMLYFMTRLDRVVPAMPVRNLAHGVRTIVAALVAGAASFGFGRLMVELLPGRLALAGVALGGALALTAYLAVALEIRPTPANARRLAGALRPVAEPPARL